VKQRSYFSRILAPPKGAVLLRSPRTPFPLANTASRPSVFPRTAAPTSVPAASSAESPSARPMTPSAQPSLPKPASRLQRASMPPGIPPMVGVRHVSGPRVPARNDIPLPRTVTEQRREQDSLRESQLEAQHPRGESSALEPRAETFSPAAHLPEHESPRQVVPMTPEDSPSRAQSVKALPADRRERVLEPSVPPRMLVQEVPAQEPPVEPGSRVEIGSIEVRLTPQALPVRKSPRPKSSEPLARRTLPFGLRQI
jgi:hypothetical protein